MPRRGTYVIPVSYTHLDVYKRQTHDFAMPHDFMTWKATCHHTHNLLEDGKRFVELYKTQYLYMMYVRCV